MYQFARNLYYLARIVKKLTDIQYIKIRFFKVLNLVQVERL